MWCIYDCLVYGNDNICYLPDELFSNQEDAAIHKMEDNDLFILKLSVI